MDLHHVAVTMNPIYQKKVLCTHCHSISWYLQDGDSCETLTSTFITTYINGTGTSAYTTFVPQGIEEYSFFHESENTELLRKSLGDSLIVSIPYDFDLLSSQPKSFSRKTAPLCSGKEIKLEPSAKIEVSATIPPNSKVIVNNTIYKNKITATYIIDLVSEDLVHKEIQGKWTGVFFKNIESNETVTEIEN